MSKIITRKIFLGANTPDGFVGFFETMVDDYNLEKLYILKGGSGVGKSTFIRNFTNQIIEIYKDKTNLTIDYILCAADPSSYDGVIIHELRIGIIDGTRPHIADPKYPGLVDEIIDLAQFINPTKITANREELRTLIDQRKQCFVRATQELYNAREIHKQVESEFIPAMNFKRVNKVLTKLVAKHSI